MARKLDRLLAPLGLDAQQVWGWYEQRMLAPISRAYSQRLGIPVIAVTGTNGKTTVTRLIGRILQEAGQRVGISCTDGVSRNGEWVARGDKAGVLGLLLAMRAGGLDALVAETARGGILKFGIGFRHCQVAVVTNVSEDHLGIDGVETLDQLAEVKARIVDRVAADGVAVLNADDPRVASMAERVPGQTMFFSMRRPGVEVDRGVFLEDDRIVRRSASGEQDLMSASDVAITRGGLLRYNLANAIATVAALDGLRPVLSVSDDVVVRVLRERLSSEEEWPLSFRLLDLAGAHVLVCPSKNPASYVEAMKAVGMLRQRHGYETIVGFITHVGNRPASFHRGIAQAAASACDHLTVVLPERRFLRGRSEESFVAALEAGVPPEKRLASREGSCVELVAALRDAFPGRTLYAFLGARQHRGVEELCRSGRPIPFEGPQG